MFAGLWRQTCKRLPHLAGAERPESRLGPAWNAIRRAKAWRKLLAGAPATCCAAAGRAQRRPLDLARPISRRRRELSVGPLVEFYSKWSAPFSGRLAARTWPRPSVCLSAHLPQRRRPGEAAWRRPVERSLDASRPARSSPRGPCSQRGPAQALPQSHPEPQTGAHFFQVHHRRRHQLPREPLRACDSKLASVSLALATTCCSSSSRRRPAASLRHSRSPDGPTLEAHLKVF